MRARHVLVFAASVAAVTACSTASTPKSAPAPQALAFQTSALSNGVPRDLLVAIAQTEGGLATPRTRVANPKATLVSAGPLQLRRGKLDTLARGAALMKTSELALREDADLALEAGARVLAEVGARTAARADSLESWDAALQEMSGYADDIHRSAYAHRVMGLLARGGTFPGRDGEMVELAPHELPPSAWMEIDTRLHVLSGDADYPDAEWFPTPEPHKWATGRQGQPITFVIIHDTEIPWDASVATLQNDTGKSVQYIVGDDGRVGQFVHEADTSYNCGNGFYNQGSIGIEHVGYMDKPFTEIQYATSAKLVNYLTAKYTTVPADRVHIVGHDQVPNQNTIAGDGPACDQSPKDCEASDDYGGINNHRDPGDWEWCTYMVRIGGTCKCDDVSARLACNNDKNAAFRCVSGAIDVFTCTGGCTPSADGTSDDTCAGQAPYGTQPASDDAGSSSGTVTPPENTDGEAPAQGADSGVGAKDAPIAHTEPGGCSASPAPSADAWPLVALAAMLSCLRRRRSPRTVRSPAR